MLPRRCYSSFLAEHLGFQLGGDIEHVVGESPVRDPGCRVGGHTVYARSVPGWGLAEEDVPEYALIACCFMRYPWLSTIGCASAIQEEDMCHSTCGDGGVASRLQRRGGRRWRHANGVGDGVKVFSKIQDLPLLPTTLEKLEVKGLKLPTAFAMEQEMRFSLYLTLLEVLFIQNCPALQFLLRFPTSVQMF